MKEQLNGLGLAFPGDTWILNLLLVVAVVMALDLLAGHLLRRAERMANTTATAWDDALIQAARQPLRALFWIVGLTYGVSLARTDLHLPELGLIKPLREVGVVLCLAWFLFRLIHHAATGVVRMQETRGEAVDHTTVDAVSKLARIVVVVIAGLMILQHMGFSVAGLLTFGGIGGIAVGLAAKDLLANFFGGLTVYLDRPFSVGDTIRSPDKVIEGTVEYIGWRHTRIRAPDKASIHVPNALFSTIVVENPSRMTHRRLREVLGLRYEDAPRVEAIVADIRALLEAHPGIDGNQAIIVNFDAYGDSALNIFILAYSPVTARAAFQALKQELLLAVGGIVARHGADFAFPSRTLYMVEPAEADTQAISRQAPPDR